MILAVARVIIGDKIILERTLEFDSDEAYTHFSILWNTQARDNFPEADNCTLQIVSRFDPILISLVRKMMPNTIAAEICGVQPMTPTTQQPEFFILPRKSMKKNPTTTGAG